jgi:competence protein ComEC
MELFRFIPIKLTALVIAGILLGHYLQPAPLVTVLATAISLFLLLGVHLRHRHRRLSLSFGILTCLTTILTGLSAYSLSLNKSHPHHYRNLDVKGIRLLHLGVREVLKPSRFGRNYVAEVKSVDCTNVKGDLLLRLPLGEFGQDFQVDDELLVAAALQHIPGPRNPYQFDYRQYLSGKGIYHQLQPAREQVAFLHTTGSSWKGMAARIRRIITTQLADSGFSADELAVVQALLLGQRQALPDDVYDSYKNAGAVHILAVSGLHVGILLWLLHFIFSPLERLPGGKAIKLLALLCFLWAYAFLAGLSASVIRAVTMFSFVAYALYLNRPSNTFNILALSMFFVLLAFNPRLLFQAGFQMSYAAVFAILGLYPRLQSVVRPRFWLFRKAWQLFSVSLVAQLGVLPISLYYFHQFPGLFFISNLLVVPFLGVLLGAGMLISLLALLRLVPMQLAAIYETMISVMNQLVAWVAGQESFLFREIPINWPDVILVYLAIIALCTLFHNGSFRRLVFLVLAIMALQLRQIVKSVQLNGKEQLWVMHLTGNTLLLHQAGPRLTAITPSLSKVSGLVSDFRVGEALRDIGHLPVSTNYYWGNGELFIMDKKGIAPELSGKPQYLLLRNSPKVNLDRILEKTTPAAVIADGSNYASFVLRWRKSCRALAIPFHDTATEGAYRLPVR